MRRNLRGLTLSLVIKNFSWAPVGTYDTYGTRIAWRILIVVSKPIIAKKQIEYLDGKEVMNYSYPDSQPVTQPGEYLDEEKSYAHIPFRLGFNPLGHQYTIILQYQDVESGIIYEAEATAIAFQTIELSVDILIAGGVAAGVLCFAFWGK